MKFQTLLILPGWDRNSSQPSCAQLGEGDQVAVKLRYQPSRANSSWPIQNFVAASRLTRSPWRRTHVKPCQGIGSLAVDIYTPTEIFSLLMHLGVMPRYRIRSVHKFRECNARGFTRQTGTCTVKPKTHNFHFPPRNCRVISLANKERRPGVRVSCYSINYSINYRARLACTGIRGDLKSS